VSNGVDYVEISVKVTDAINPSAPAPTNVLVKFESDRVSPMGKFYSQISPTLVEADAGGVIYNPATTKWTVYYVDNGISSPGIAHITATVNNLKTSITNPVAPANIECLPPDFVTVDTTNLKIEEVTNKNYIYPNGQTYPKNDYLITVGFNINSQFATGFTSISDIKLAALNPEVNVKLDNLALKSPYIFIGGKHELLVPVSIVNKNNPFTLKLSVTFSGIDPNGIKYSKTGTLTISGDKTTLDATNTKINFP
jgi:hypothetical protein